MTHKSTMFAIIAGCLVTGWMLQPVMAGKGNGNGKGGGAVTIPVVTEDEAVDLLFMREEEKLARDVYITMYALWGNRVFDNISQAEQKHDDAVFSLIEKYGLTDPALAGIGNFTNSELQELYDALIAKGEVSVLEALKVGALIEEVDIEDIVLSMERTDKVDILNVYGNLLAGSENHLVAFVKNIESLTGTTYEAQYISQEEVDAIQGR
ncbi:DUF2202 domain-containing protein [Pontiellaceae bacterium B1224]|nr:DUF2202 domain-containing protein [Pontiellaceae bacterium B1224]